MITKDILEKLFKFLDGCTELEDHLESEYPDVFIAIEPQYILRGIYQIGFLRGYEFNTILNADTEEK